ncbi:MAG: hypothetical protein JXO44_03320 [Clostridia bacterium]|nr:hypothetical protein [Clostridia bacterium]
MILIVILISAAVVLLRMNIEKGAKSLREGKRGQQIAQKYEYVYLKSLLSPSYKQLKDTIYINELPEETQLSRKAFFSMTKILMRMIIITLIYVVLAKGAYVLMAIPLSVIIFDESLIRYLRKNDVSKPLISGMELYKNRYIKHENCRIALEKTIEERSGIVRRHFELLHSLITVPSSDAKKNLDIYFTKMPNDQLKLIAMNNYIAYFDGDREERGESVLVANTQSVINQMRRASIQKERFFREIKTDNFKMLSPIIVLPAVKYFMMMFASKMPEMDEYITVFYNGIYGQLVVAFVLIFMIFSYKIHSKFVSEKYLINIPKVKINKWLAPLLKTFFRVKPKKEQRLKERFMEAGRIVSIPAYYQSKIITCILVVLFSVLFIGINHAVEEKKIIENLLYSQSGQVYYQNLEMVLENKSSVEKKELIDEEKAIINRFRNGTESDDELKEKLEELGLSAVQVKRITSKLKVLKGINLNKVKLILLITGLGIIGYHYPAFSLEMDRYINKNAYVADDVSRLYSVAIILSKNKNMTVKALLKWLESYSVAFRPYFMKINDVYHEQGARIIKQVYSEIHDEDMRLLFDNIMSGEELPLTKAFKGIEHTLNSKLDDRQEEIEYGVDFQITLSEELASLVGLSALVLYGGIPLFIAIYRILENMNTTIQMF